MTPEEVPADAARQWQWRPDAVQRLGVELSADTNETLRARLNSLGLDSVRSADWIDPDRLRGLYVQERTRELAHERGASEQDTRDDADSEMRSMAGPAGLNRQLEYLQERRVDLPLDLADDPNRLRDAVTQEMLRREPLSEVEHQALITGLRNWRPGVAAWNTDAGEMFPALVAHTMGIRLHIRADGDSRDHGADDPRDVGLMGTGHRVEVFYNGQDHYDASQLSVPSRVSSDEAVRTVGTSAQLQEESASPHGMEAFNANRAASAPSSTEGPEGSVGPRVGDAHSSLTPEPEFVVPQDISAEGRTATGTPSSFADLSQESQPIRLPVAASSDGHASRGLEGISRDTSTHSLPRGLDYQQEISFPGGIKRENIVGAEQVLPQEIGQGSSDGAPVPTAPVFGDFVHKPSFDPHMPDAAAALPMGPVRGSYTPPSPAPSSELRFSWPSHVSEVSINWGRSSDGEPSSAPQYPREPLKDVAAAR